MVDITAKRGPRDPAEGLTNQGVATQAKLNSMAREHQYELQKKLKKKSTWDSIVGGIGDVINIGKGVMDIANSYEDLQVKDEQVKRSELMRQQQELNLEASKQQMVVQSLQNEMQLKELTADNEFLDTFNNYIKSNDYTGAASYAFQYPKSANKYQAELLNVANQLEKNGDNDTANALRLSAFSGDKSKMAKLMYGSDLDPDRARYANPEQAKTQLMYKANVNALIPQFTSEDNGTKLSKLGLRDDQYLADDLLSCAIKISTSNTVNDNKDRENYVKSLKLNSLDNLQSTSSDNGKNVMFADITCPVNGVPHTEQFVFNAKDKVRVQNYNDKGLPTGETMVPISTALSSIISRHNQYQSIIRESINNTAKVAQAEQVMQLGTAPRTEEVVDTRKVEEKTTTPTKEVLSANEAKQQYALANKDYTTYSVEVYKDLKNISNELKDNPQALAAIIDSKVATLSKDPDALNSYINGPMSNLAKTLEDYERTALERYIPKMGLAKKQEIATIIMTAIAKRKPVESTFSKLKKVIYSAPLFKEAPEIKEYEDFERESENYKKQSLKLLNKRLS